jgi:pSer/pThr/pTyr-binding forkhead associated (FHA) protein
VALSGRSDAELEFLDGGRAGDVVRLEGARTVIGRQVGDLLIEDKEISSIHAIISFERGGWYVMDLGSTNGVFVDEQVKLESRLASGVVLRFGQTRATFTIDGGADQETDEETDEDTDRSAVQDTGRSAVVEQPVAPHLVTLPRILLGETVRNETSAAAKEAANEDAASGTKRNPTLPGQGADLLAGMAETVSVQVSLEIVEGADTGAIRTFQQESILIGRLNTDLVVRDSDVSRRHTIIEVFDGSQIYLRDLNSTNGTFVNGRRVSSVRLRNGDQIRLGRCLLRFSARPT